MPQVESNAKSIQLELLLNKCLSCCSTSGIRLSYVLWYAFHSRSTDLHGEWQADGVEAQQLDATNHVHKVCSAECVLTLDWEP